MKDESAYTTDYTRPTRKCQVIGVWDLVVRNEVGLSCGPVSLALDALARRIWGQALVARVPPRWDEAEAHMAQSLRSLEEGQSRLEAARTHLAWGTVCRDRGDLTAVRAHWERAAARWETSGLTHELERTRALMERVAIA